MKILILSILLRGPFDVGFQMSDFGKDSLPPRAELFATLRTFHNENADANAAALNIVERRAWTTVLPSFGVSFGQPTVSFSVGQYFDYKERKALRAAERSKILRGSNLAFKSDSFALVALLERIETARDALPMLSSAERIENQRFDIEKEKYRNGTLAPLAWLDAQAANLRSGEAVRLKLEEIALLEIAARNLAKY
jgi:hypothetical protein